MTHDPECRFGAYGHHCTAGCLRRNAATWRKPADEPVIWAGRTFGQLTREEQQRAVRAAGAALSAELTASAGAIGAAMDAAGLDEHELDLLRSYSEGPRIWDAASIWPQVLALAGKGLVVPTGDRGAYQLTAAGRAVLDSGN